jgi:hypothetical protein
MTDRSKVANKKRAQFWRYHIDTWSRSGLAQNAYYRANNLKPNRLTYWKNKFKRQNLPVEFIQVPQVKIATTTNSQFRDVLRLNIDSGFQIEVPDGVAKIGLVYHLLF